MSGWLLYALVGTPIGLLSAVVLAKVVTQNEPKPSFDSEEMMLFGFAAIFAAIAWPLILFLTCFAGAAWCIGRIVVSLSSQSK